MCLMHRFNLAAHMNCNKLQPSFNQSHIFCKPRVWKHFYLSLNIKMNDIFREKSFLSVDLSFFLSVDII